MIQIGNASLKAIPGKGNQCNTCDFLSATLYEIRLSDIMFTVCPFCKSMLFEILIKENKLYDNC